MRQSFAEQTQNRPHRPILEKALQLLAQQRLIQHRREQQTLARTAIDCGCGAGNESAYLLANDYRVDAFDADITATQICAKRFIDQPQYSICQNSFENYIYPKASLIVALYSLFFCPEAYLEATFHKMTAALPIGGLLVINLLGKKDQWLSTYPEKFVGFEYCQIEKLFQDQFNIVFHEEFLGEHPLGDGTLKYWNTHMLILQKKI
ncbi:tellurite resistance protein TehB [Acinetobacter calcoaceticus]|uniref:Tellurite resistance protein TehB n=1 Tax=Acinetobacter calcoaceticus TaxID=471 RepID=A0A4R1XWY1_ACICA|nr:tellurite resistance protein TehB [Acinetobacter calcoaceticus]